jgi:hypothetical protein
MSERLYRRRLSAMERYCLVIHRAYHYHVDGVIEGVGHVDADALRVAIARAAQANPGVRVRLRGWLGWAHWVDSGIAPELHVIDDCDWDGASEVGAPFYARRLDPAHGAPVSDLYLLRCRDGRTRLVFRALHAAIDGRGMMYWMTEVCRALRGEAPLGSASTLTDMDVQARHVEAVAQGRADEAAAAVPTPTPALCLPVVEPSPDTALAYVWRRIVIPHAVVNQLPKSAVFLAQWARRGGDGDVGFTIPVDYRGLRTDEMGIGNLTGYVRLKIAPDDTPRSLMLQIKRSLAAHADCRQFPGMRVILWLPLWYMLKKLREQLHTILYTVNKDSPSGGIVSMGAWQTGWFSFPGFAATMTYGIPGSVGKLNLLFSNYPDCSVVTFAAPAAYNRDGQLDAMIQAYQAYFSP